MTKHSLRLKKKDFNISFKSKTSFFLYDKK